MTEVTTNKQKPTACETILGAHAKTFWGKRILEAETNSEFTEDDRHRAIMWTTCACGKLDQRLLNHNGCPSDNELFNLGCDFNDAVCRDKIVGAANLLVQIENRATELLSQLPAK